MTLYVNNKTAMRFWCMEPRPLDESTQASSLTTVKDADTTLRHISSECVSLFATERQVVHVFVDEDSRRSKSPRLVYHLREAPFPSGAFRRLSHDVLISSPELSFLEMANKLPFFKLVEYGFLLCGTYTLCPGAEDPNKRGPLTTKRKIASFIERMGKARGCAVARRALDLVLENSASPRETKTAILLCVPTRLGGYGFASPEMNYRIDFNDEERLLFRKEYVELDLYWRESHFGIEYDGGDNHSIESDVARDRRKSSELNYCGITVARVDKEQLSSPFQVFVLAKKCARIMGRSLRKPTLEQLQCRQKLFEEVMK